MSQTSKEITHRLDWIEVARGFAAVAVVLYHVARHVEKTREVNFWSTLFQFGHAGVDLFFVISGFVILHAHYIDLGHPERFAHYLNRRLTRIYPPYWVALALTIAMGAIGKSGFPDVWNLVSSAMLLPSNQEPLLGVAWTLQYEVVFYALFALLIFHKGVGVTVLVVWLLGIGVQLFVHVPTWGLPSSLFATYNLEFLMGLVVAYGLRHWRMPSSLILVGLGGSCFVFWAALENLQIVDGYAPWMRLAYGSAAAIFIAGCAVAGKAQVSIPGWMRALGSASYSIYLFQFVFIGLLWQLTSAIALHADWLPHFEFVFFSAGAVIGGVWVSRVVEYPLMGWIRRRIAAGR